MCSDIDLTRKKKIKKLSQAANRDGLEPDPADTSACKSNQQKVLRWRAGEPQRRTGEDDEGII